MKSSIQCFTEKLFSPIDAASLGMFRILFGALMFWQSFYFLEKGRYIQYFVKPDFHFSYEMFPFVRAWPEKWLFVHLVVMALAALGIMLGLFYRFCVFIFLIAFSYIFLIDKVYYNNHYYLIILLSFLMLLVDGNRWASLDQKMKPKPAVIPFWNLFLLRAQIFIVFFFGGIAKVNPDWLAGEPMRSWLQHKSNLPVVGPFLATAWAPYFFSWGGALFDLSIGFFLLWRRTRFFAYAAVLFFNLTNAVLFKIGVFPYLMIAATTLFDDPDWPRKVIPKLTPSPFFEALKTSGFQRGVVLSFLGVYLFLQILIPLRHWFYPGDVNWTEEGHLFSWHMKLRDKEGKLKIRVTDPQTNSSQEVNLKEELNQFQIGKLVQRPQFIYQYIQHLKQISEKEGIQNPIIQVDAQISLNGRPYQQAIDPQINLAEAKSGIFAHDTWILPLNPQAKPGELKKANAPKEKEEVPETPELPL